MFPVSAAAAAAASGPKSVIPLPTIPSEFLSAGYLYVIILSVFVCNVFF